MKGIYEYMQKRKCIVKRFDNRYRNKWEVVLISFCEKYNISLSREISSDFYPGYVAEILLLLLLFSDIRIFLMPSSRLDNVNSTKIADTQHTNVCDICHVLLLLWLCA